MKADMMKAVLRTALLKRLREQMGKVYSVSVTSSSGQYPTFLSRSIIGFVCQPEDVDTLVAATNEEVQRLCENPEQFAASLDDVKLNLIKENQLQLQKTAYWTSWIRNSIYNCHEDWTWNSRYEEIVNSMTVNDVADFARWAIREAHLVRAILEP